LRLHPNGMVLALISVAPPGLAPDAALETLFERCRPRRGASLTDGVIARVRCGPDALVAYPFEKGIPAVANRRIGVIVSLPRNIFAAAGALCA